MRPGRNFLIWAVLWSTASVTMRQILTEVELRSEGDVLRLRPLESVVLQLRGYGGRQNEDGEKVRIRVRIDAAKFRLVEQGTGWLSKPFRYQGEEKETIYEPETASLVDLIIGRARDDFLRLDSVLYTAAEEPGNYTIEASSGKFSDRLTIRVDPGAPAQKPAEQHSFRREPRRTDPYLPLAEHYAPFIAQATWFQPKADYITRFDFDGDWKGDNNWDSTPSGTSQAYVYFAVIESETHWFLIYSFFHPRDYSDNCVGGSCHENDSEGMILTVLKDGSEFGRIQVLETLAHDNVYSYRLDRRVRKGVHGFDGDFLLVEETRPAVFIESGGHGVYSAGDGHSKYDLSRDEFSPGTGVTYVYKGRAERPRHPDDRLVGYQLLPMFPLLWQRAHPVTAGALESFSDYYDYTPYGGRPDVPYDQIAGAFMGNRFGANKAKPFWGWRDRKTSKKRIVATGQWALDPAYAVSRNLRFPRPFSLTYVYNPYLGIWNRRPVQQ